MTPEQVKLLARFAAAHITRPTLRHSTSHIFRSIAGSLLIHILMVAALLSPVVQLPVTNQPSTMEFFWLSPFFRMDGGSMAAEPVKPILSPTESLPPPAVVEEKITGPAVKLPAMPLERVAAAPFKPVPVGADLVTAAPVAPPKQRVALSTETMDKLIQPPPPVVENREIHQEEKAAAERMALLQAEQERLKRERVTREKAEQGRRVRDEAARAAEQERLAGIQQKELERLAMEKSAAERKRLEQVRLEKLASDTAERERSAREESRRKIGLERLTREKEQREKLALEKNEREQARLAALVRQSEAERQARTQAELERARQEKIRLERLKQEAAALEQKARDERLAYEKSLQDKLFAEKVERERKASEEGRLKAEHDRLGREQAKRERLAREAVETAKIAEQARLGREQYERNLAVAERARLEQLAVTQAKKVAEETKKLKAVEQKGIPVPAVHGDMKLAITGDSRISLEVRFRPFPKSRRNRQLTRSESRKESQIVPIMVNKGDNTREAVITQAREGIYTFIVSLEKVEQNGSFVLTLHDNTSGKSVKKLGKKTAGERAILTRVLMPEGILWEDESVFSGSIEDSDGVLKFNSETGLLWKEYGE